MPFRDVAPTASPQMTSRSWFVANSSLIGLGCRLYFGSPRNRSLSRPLADVECPTYLRPRKPVPAQSSYSGSVNHGAGASELLALGASVSQARPNSLLDE